jgi:hypothetical protein
MRAPFWWAAGNCAARSARPFGQTAHAGLEFDSNGRVQLLESGGAGLIAASSAPTGSFTLLPSGQFMLRGALSLDEYAVFARFDESFDALEIDAFGTTLRYARGPRHGQRRPQRLLHPGHYLRHGRRLGHGER